MSFLRDLRHSGRSLLKSPAFSLSVVLCLALGIGATSATFSVVDAVLLRALPYEDPGRIVLVWDQFLAQGEDQVPTSGAEYVDIRDGNRVFAQTAAFIPHILNLTGEGEPERLLTGRVSASLFPLLGVQAVVGRTFLPEEDQVGNNQVVLLSYGFWSRRFGADPGVVGRKLTLNGSPYTVVGVLPRSFDLEEGRYEVFIPVALNPAILPALRQARAFKVYGRLRPGVDLTAARGDMKRLAAQLQERFPAIYTETSGWAMNVETLRDEVLGDVRPALAALSLAVGLVLVIACVNVANLLLARGLARRREVAVRLAFGAQRFDLARRFFAEGLLLSVAGAAFGLLLTWGLVRAILALHPDGIPRLAGVGIDLRVILFTFGLALATGVLFGMVPVLQRRDRLQEVLKEGGRTGSEGGRSLRGRKLLVVAEIALALAVTVGAGLMARTFLGLLNEKLGFESGGKLVLQLWLPKQDFAQPAQAVDFLSRVLDRVAAIPGVENAALSSSVPLQGFHQFDAVEVEGHPPGEPLPSTEWFGVSPEYFHTMGITLLEGRAFTPSDHAEAAKVAIIDQELARRYFPDGSALGHTVTLGGGADATPRRIVGVVAHVKCQGLAVTSIPQIYLPYRQFPRPLWFLILQTPGDPAALGQAARRAIWAIAPNEATSKVQTLDEIVSAALGGARFQTLLFGSFALVALLLATVGVYGLIAYSVAQRTQEIGIRMALGAGRRSVLGKIVREGVELGGFGVLLGLPMALALAKTMSSLLYGVGTTDLATFASVAVALELAVLLAAFVPAHRATRVSPSVALREE